MSNWLEILGVVEFYNITGDNSEQVDKELEELVSRVNTEILGIASKCDYFINKPSKGGTTIVTFFGFLRDYSAHQSLFMVESLFTEIFLSEISIDESWELDAYGRVQISDRYTQIILEKDTRLKITRIE